MEPNGNTALTDTHFTSDQPDDLANKEDTPVIENGEIVNEPDDVEENAPGAVPQNNNDGSECFFPIHFTFNDVDYTADVQKTKNLFAEYHITGVTPTIGHLPDPYVIAKHFSDDKFDFPVNETYYPQSLGLAIIKGLHDGSGEHARASFF